MATYPPNTNNLVPSTTPGPGFQGENAYGMTPTTNATGIVLQRLCVQLLRYGSFLDDRSKPRNSFLAEWDRDVPAINLSSVFSDNDLVELETGRAEQRQTSLSWIDLNARHAARRSIPFQAVASLSQPFNVTIFNATTFHSLSTISEDRYLDYFEGILDVVNTSLSYPVHSGNYLLFGSIGGSGVCRGFRS